MFDPSRPFALQTSQKKALPSQAADGSPNLFAVGSFFDPSAVGTNRDQNSFVPGQLSTDNEL